MRYSLIAVLFVFIVGCESKPYITREDRRLQNRNEYIILHPNDLAIDITAGETPSTSNQDIFLCVQLYAEDEVQEPAIGKHVNIDAGKMLIDNSSSTSATSKTIRLPLLVQDAAAVDSPSERMLFHFVLAEGQHGETLFFVNTREVSARQISADLIEMGVVQAVGIERKNFNNSWYRYANTIFSCGKGQPKEELSEKYLILKNTSR